MKKAMIYAYTAGNLGDDLFIHILCTRYPKTKFYLCAPTSYEETFSYLANLHIIRSDCFFQKMTHKVLKAFSYREQIAKTCDVAIYIGGSIFIETPNWKKSIRQINTKKKKGQPFFIIGANFGPYEDDKFYQTYEQFFRNCTDICFRDKLSRDLFHHLPNVRQAADVVFQLPQDKTVREEEQRRILISVIYPSIRDNLAHVDQMYFNAVAKIAIYCLEKGFEIMFMSFCEREKDNLAIDEIMSLIPHAYENKIHTYFYQTNIKEALQQIASAKAIIATRFHAMILSWVYEKTVFPIVYSPKMETVIDDCQFTGEYSKLELLHKVDPENIVQALQAKYIDISVQRKDAERQFMALDKILKKDVV